MITFFINFQYFSIEFSMCSNWILYVLLILWTSTLQRLLFLCLNFDYLTKAFIWLILMHRTLRFALHDSMNYHLLNLYTLINLLSWLNHLGNYRIIRFFLWKHRVCYSQFRKLIILLKSRKCIVSILLLIGEIRVNEQLVLTCMHTLMAREHNRIAKALAVINPHWDDEILFQEARRIVIAEIQHVTYNEFLPILLGKDVMEKFGLLLEKEVSWTDDTETNWNKIYEYLCTNYKDIICYKQR